MGVDRVTLETKDGRVLDEVGDEYGMITALFRLARAPRYRIVERIPEYGEDLALTGSEVEAFLEDWTNLLPAAPGLVELNVIAPQEKKRMLAEADHVRLLAMRCLEKDLLLRFHTQ